MLCKSLWIAGPSCWRYIHNKRRGWYFATHCCAFSLSVMSTVWVWLRKDFLHRQAACPSNRIRLHKPYIVNVERVNAEQNKIQIVNFSLKSPTVLADYSECLCVHCSQFALRDYNDFPTYCWKERWNKDGKSNAVPDVKTKVNEVLTSVGVTWFSDMLLHCTGLKTMRTRCESRVALLFSASDYRTSGSQSASDRWNIIIISAGRVFFSAMFLHG